MEELGIQLPTDLRHFSDGRDRVIASPVLWAIIMMFTLTRCLVIDGRRRSYRREHTKENITPQNTLSRFVL